MSWGLMRMNKIIETNIKIDDKLFDEIENMGYKRKDKYTVMYRHNFRIQKKDNELHITYTYYDENGRTIIITDSEKVRVWKVDDTYMVHAKNKYYYGFQHEVMKHLISDEDMKRINN